MSELGSTAVQIVDKFINRVNEHAVWDVAQNNVCAS